MNSQGIYCIFLALAATASLPLYGQSTPAETGTVPKQAKATLYFSLKHQEKSMRRLSAPQRASISAISPATFDQTEIIYPYLSIYNSHGADGHLIGLTTV